MQRACGNSLLGGVLLSLLGVTSVFAQSDDGNRKKSTFSDIKTVWVILMENHNWTGNNAGAALGAPDISPANRSSPPTSTL